VPRRETQATRNEAKTIIRNDPARIGPTVPRSGKFQQVAKGVGWIAILRLTPVIGGFAPLKMAENPDQFL